MSTAFAETNEAGEIPTLLSPQEAAARCGFSISTLRRLEEQGAFPRRVMMGDPSQRKLGVYIASEVDSFIRHKIKRRDEVAS